MYFMETKSALPTLTILRKSPPPPCMGRERVLCRGCPGWEAMRAAVSPGGPWEGEIIHCPCTGLVARGPGRAEKP